MKNSELLKILKKYEERSLNYGKICLSGSFFS